LMSAVVIRTPVPVPPPPGTISPSFVQHHHKTTYDTLPAQGLAPEQAAGTLTVDHTRGPLIIAILVG
jgi:hypothetical protein